MQTKTDHTVTLSPEDTAKAVFDFLREHDMPVPATPAGLKIKWTAKGEATVSFSVGGDAGVATSQTQPPVLHVRQTT